VRHIHAEGTRRFKYLDEIPYLLGRLDEPGVAQRCIAQFDEFTEARHHRLSQMALARSSPLRAAVEAVQPDGTGLSPELQIEQRGIAGIPLDDSIAESPHARAAHLKGHSHGCSWEWMASSMRLEQNLSDLRALPSIVDFDVQREWSAYTRILQKSGGVRGLRAKRMKRQELVRQVYHMSDWLETSGDPPLADGDGQPWGGKVRRASLPPVLTSCCAVPSAFHTACLPSSRHQVSL
jgi:hypothetical protein